MRLYWHAGTKATKPETGVQGGSVGDCFYITTWLYSNITTQLYNYMVI